MNMKRFLLAVVVGFLFVLGSDFLIHGVWLAGDYKASSGVWRPDADMQAAFFPWIVGAQVLAALSFVLLWAKGFAGRDLGTGAIVGLYMGMFQSIWALVNYAVIPIPRAVAIKWFLVGILQAILLGIIVAAIYKPATASASVDRP